MTWSPAPPFPGDADPGVKNPSSFDPNRPLARELELSLDTRTSFSVVAVGDCIISRPLSGYVAREPRFSTLVDMLQGAHCTYGNMETVIFDARYFRGSPYSWAGDWPLVSSPDVAADLATMGFDVFSRANNHALDWGLEGMRESSRWLDAAGLTHAGIGESLGKARAAAYFESDLGRVGVVSCVSTYRDTTNALDENGAAPGRPGVGDLAVTQNVVVTPEVLEELRRLTDHLPTEMQDMRHGARLKPENEDLTVLGRRLIARENVAARYSYTMDQSKVSSILRAVRQGKQHSDFLIVTIHSHEPADDSADPMPADFLTLFGHAAVDAGADMVITTGIHHAQPIEIYKGRPIFYGLGNFVWSDIQQPLAYDLYADNEAALVDAFTYPTKVTDADLSNLLNAGNGDPSQGFNTFLTFTSVLTRTTFTDNRLQDVKLYPIQMGWPPERLTRSGIPRLATGTVAQDILVRLLERCAAYNTKLTIEPYTDTFVGVIRP